MNQKFRKQNINRFEDFLAKKSFTELESIFLESIEGEKRIHSDYGDSHRNTFIKELKPVLLEWVDELRRGYTAKAVEKELAAYQTFMYYLDEIQQTKELPATIEKKKQKLEARGFEWVGETPKRQIKNLYELLTKTSKLIKSTPERPNIPICFVSPKTDFEIFEKAFNNKELKNPLCIEWMVTAKNNKVSKSALIDLIQTLDSRKYTVYNPSIFNQQVSKIFIGDNGKPLQNLKQSRSEYEIKGKSEFHSVISLIIDKLDTLT